eukprot:1024249_1
MEFGKSNVIQTVPKSTVEAMSVYSWPQSDCLLVSYNAAFECNEVDYKDEYGSELTNLFTKKHCSWGYPETFKRTLFMNLKKKNIMQCTIKCMMKRVLMVKTITVPVSTSSSSIG